MSSDNESYANVEHYETKVELVIRTPIKIKVYREDEECTEEECWEFALDWHRAVVNAATNLQRKVDNDEFIEEFTEFYNKDGDICDFEIEEVRG